MLAQPGPTWHTLTSPENWAMILAMVTLTVPCVIVVVAYYWHQVTKARIDADLKHAMLERGMSAEDIERILRAKSAGK